MTYYLVRYRDEVGAGRTRAFDLYADALDFADTLDDFISVDTVEEGP